MSDLGSTTVGDLLVDQQGWDQYWNQENQGGVVYASIASFYRKVIIRPCLNRLIFKHFPQGAKLLHAGCGSGQVDTEICQYAQITALDISPNALALHQSNTAGRCTPLLGSIFRISVPDSSFDGVYNLGVLEHFTEENIHRMLCEFHRVLGPKGKLVIFWPPSFGLSVLFFKALSSVVRSLTKRQSTFHPDEISLLLSHQYGEKILRKAGFELVEYSFGVQDAWTHAILVAKKLD